MPDIEPPVSVISVSQWADLIDRFGAMMIVGIVLGLFFLLIASMMFRRLMNQGETQEKLRSDREIAIDAERREMTERVIQVTNASVEAIASMANSMKRISHEVRELRSDLDGHRQDVEQFLKPHAQHQTGEST